MSPLHLRNLEISRNRPEDSPELPRVRRSGHLGNHSGWQDTEGNHTHSAINLTVQQKPQDRGLEGYRSSASAPPTPQIFTTMEYGQQGAPPSITLGRTWSKLPEDMSQRDLLHR
ncbi:hypothetical protein O181_010708 [Austropuccinia psidii MF-1]|uniref:Uncharacterized protein n=1 Tax=Austropuccinia psidii MF-1 TaxID=1389203 RepID=A0A9Q3GKM0_9BASI|nr:hypothetical protein [Austropuccinia psidii MF-1]